MVNDEIFYLEATLCVEKTMDEVRQSIIACNESCDDGFIFESAGNVFQRLKEKIIKLVDKIKGIFTSKTMKKKNAEVSAAVKGAKGTIEVRDTQSLEKLRKECKKDLKAGKDPEKVKAKWKKGLAILGFVAAGAATAAGVAAGVKHYKKKKLPTSQAGNLLEDNSKKMNTAQIEMKDTIKLLDGETMKAKESSASAKKRGVIYGTDTRGKGTIQQGMNKLGLPDKGKDTSASAFHKDIAARASVETEIHSDYSKALIAVNNDVYTGIKNNIIKMDASGNLVRTGGSKTQAGVGKRIENMITSINSIEDKLRRQNNQLKKLKRMSTQKGRKNDQKLKDDISHLQDKIKQNEELLAGFNKRLTTLKKSGISSGDRLEVASASNDFIKTVDVMIEHVCKLQHAVDVMLERTDILLESVSIDEGFSFNDDDLFGESFDDDTDDLFGESYDDILGFVDDDDDLFGESFDDDTDDLFGESYDDILGFVDDDDLFDDVHTI